MHAMQFSKAWGWPLTVFSVVLSLAVSHGTRTLHGEEASTRVAALTEKPVPFIDEPFSSEQLDPKVWVVTRKNDFQESTIDVVGAKADERRLRLRASTMGTVAKTVKFHGVRTVNPVVELQHPLELSFDLDWNEQANGCYLTAGMYLCPTIMEENPADEKEWVKVEYIGVWPGKNARMLVAFKYNGRVRNLYTEGWPEEQKIGRKIGVQRVRLVLTRETIQVWENDALLYEGKFENVDQLPRPLTWQNAHIYLQQSSHSNYRAREVFFDNIKASALPPDGA